MARKRWKYEEDCKRMDALLALTAKDGRCPGWDHCARLVMSALRDLRPRATPLVLHFIGISAKEMLDARHESAKLCLLVAYTLCNKVFLARQLELFELAFRAPCDCPKCRAEKAAATPQFPLFLEALSWAIADMGKLPDGKSKLVLFPGIEATVVKQKLPPPSLPPYPLSSPSLWN